MGLPVKFHTFFQKFISQPIVVRISSTWARFKGIELNFQTRPNMAKNYDRFWSQL